MRGNVLQAIASDLDSEIDVLGAQACARRTAVPSALGLGSRDTRWRVR